MGLSRFLSRAGAAVAIALVAWPATSLAAHREEHPRTQTYTDATGDSGAAGDISTVDLTLDAQDFLTITVNEPNRPAIVVPDSLAIQIDADDNAATGSPGGAEYELIVGPGTVKLAKWDGSAFVDVPAANLTVAAANGQVAIKIYCGDLDFPDAIAFLVQTSEDALATVGDSAPDGPARWEFALETTAKVSAGALRLSSARAGRVFTASMIVGVSFVQAFALAPDRGTEDGSTICSATLAGKPLRALRQSFSGDRANCAWRLPKTAHGKQLRGQVRVEVDEGSASRSFSVRVV